MQEFMLLFRNAPHPDGYAPSPEEMQASIPKWQKWIGEIAQQGKLVSTAPLHFEGRTIKDAKVTDGPFVEIKERVNGYLICKAENLEEAVTFGKGCPIFDFPNGSVEVRPIMLFPM